jgi:hypothetical protein
VTSHAFAAAKYGTIAVSYKTCKKKNPTIQEVVNRGAKFSFWEVVRKFFKIHLPQQTFCLSPDRLPQQSFDGY